jgi:hypothetical protein
MRTTFWKAVLAAALPCCWPAPSATVARQIAITATSVQPALVEVPAMERARVGWMRTLTKSPKRPQRFLVRLFMRPSC